MKLLKRYKNMIADERIRSVFAFSLLFGYLLSFVFEGQVLYHVMRFFHVEAIPFVFTAIIAHLAGLLSSGIFFTPHIGAKKTMMTGIIAAAAATVPFFFALPPLIWSVSLVISAYTCGIAVAAWGYYLKTCTPRNQRYKTTADVLIYSNIIMMIANGLATYIHPMVGLWMCLFVILSAAYYTKLLPDDVTTATLPEQNTQPVRIPMAKSIFVLVVFVIALTVNSGLMYQVFIPAYKGIDWLTGWYWAVPYILALYMMRALLQKSNRAYFLYIGMVMIMFAFIAFMFTAHNAWSYLLVNTLMLGACGIFDLFWWSIIGELLEFSKNIVRTAGICISSNVLGVLLGGLLGYAISAGSVPPSHVTVLALAIVCITTAILPLLNTSLLQLLKSNVYLNAFASLPEEAKKRIVSSIPMLSPLSPREKDVLNLLLEAKTNKEIAQELSISEYTVKTHVKNIYAKYDVTSRAELITSVLKNQTDTVI